jgi:hypothetical protein
MSEETFSELYGQLAYAKEDYEQNPTSTNSERVMYLEDRIVNYVHDVERASQRDGALAIELYKRNKELEAENARLQAEREDVVTEEESRAHHLDLENSELQAENARLREAVQWIPVGERNPEIHDFVWALFSNPPQVLPMIFARGKWFYDSACNEESVEFPDAWQLPPQPPEVS